MYTQKLQSSRFTRNSKLTFKLMPFMCLWLAGMLSVSTLRGQTLHHGGDTCYAQYQNHKVYIPPIYKHLLPENYKPNAGRNKVGTTFIVNYNGFTPQAQAAFQFAVDIWAAEVISEVPIVINANFDSLASNTLGAAAPADFAIQVPNAPDPNTAYPLALANSIAGEDLAPGFPDIVTTFNNQRTDFYFGLDGQTPTGQFDFVSIVLHELGHGLGFTGTTNQGNGIGFNSGTFQNVYDLTVELGNGTRIIDLGFGTDEQQNAIISNNLFQGGPQAQLALEGTRPRMFAPNPFQSGSSYSHLNEATFLPGDENSLMTPGIGQAEAIHDIGEAVRGIFRDMGWTFVADVDTNVRVNQVALLVDECSLSDATAIEITVSNLGTEELNGVPLFIEVFAEEALQARDSLLISSISGLEQIVLNSELDLNDFNTYEVIAYSAQPGDQNPDDDTASLLVQTRLPTIAASNIFLSSIQDFELNISWTSGDGEQRLVLVKAGSDFVEADLPQDSISYPASFNFGSVDPIGEAFPVFRGTDNRVTVVGLEGGETYFVAVVEFSCVPPIYRLEDIASVNTIVTDLENQLPKNAVRVFPNPSQQTIQVSLDQNLLNEGKISLYNGQGRQLKQYTISSDRRESSQISLDDLPAGLYLLKINSPQGTLSKKIIVE